MVFTQDVCRLICPACWKSLKFVKYFENLEKQMHLDYCPGSNTYSVKFSSIYLFSSNLYEFLKQSQFFLAGKTLAAPAPNKILSPARWVTSGDVIH